MEENTIEVPVVEVAGRDEETIVAEVIENEIEVQDEGDNLEKVEE